MVENRVMFLCHSRPTGEAPWCLLLVVGVGIAKNYRQITLDRQGKQQQQQQQPQLLLG